MKKLLILSVAFAFVSIVSVGYASDHTLDKNEVVIDMSSDIDHIDVSVLPIDTPMCVVLESFDVVSYVNPTVDQLIYIIDVGKQVTCESNLINTRNLSKEINLGYNLNHRKDLSVLKLFSTSTDHITPNRSKFIDRHRYTQI